MDAEFRRLDSFGQKRFKEEMMSEKIGGNDDD